MLVKCSGFNADEIWRPSIFLVVKHSRSIPSLIIEGSVLPFSCPLYICVVLTTICYWFYILLHHWFSNVGVQIVI